ncbi:30S ribosomal protein S13 [Candidatus Falkowbacteria bacterium RIFOXYD2_FULL_35_9]|nr:MAG: 30S ribosomal protein S13 [Candidatus Falkowbacteria bacterium RIFOXYD2_FULL_35_9]
MGLTYIYGIGKAVSTKILNQTKIDINKKVKDLTDDEVSRLRAIIENDMRTEGSLRRDVLTDIKRLKEIKSYRGSRHSRSLPARGQRTKTNSRTVRGNVRRTAGSGKKASAQKT